MKIQFHLLQIELFFQTYQSALLCFITAFVVTLITIPPIIKLIRKFNLFDMPSERKEHVLPIPTMGGIAILAGMALSLIMWFPFQNSTEQISFFFSVLVLFGVGVMDDLKNLSAKYKFIVQSGLALLIAIAGIRINSFDGLLGIHDLPVTAQYTFTFLTIVGITNAFNLIDGIDGLAGSLGFLSLITLGIFLSLNGDINTALIAFALAGGILAFLYFNFNPARIFMGDTGSLILGFVISVLCIRLIQVNTVIASPYLTHAPVIVLSIVFIPVFDTLRVFAIRIWRGGSPFMADKSHLHHLLTNQGFSHLFATRLICVVHCIILLEAHWLRNLPQELIVAILLLFMLITTIIFKHFGILYTGTQAFFLKFRKIF